METKSIRRKERKRNLTTLVFVFQSGLIVACYHGYVDIVIALSQCPYLDVNWQDNEGNTALITAAQAGENKIFCTVYFVTSLPVIKMKYINKNLMLYSSQFFGNGSLYC